MERLPFRAKRSAGCRFLFFACCSALSEFSAPPRDRFGGRCVAAPRESFAAYGAYEVVELITPRRRERRGTPPNPAGFSRDYAETYSLVKFILASVRKNQRRTRRC